MRFCKVILFSHCHLSLTCRSSKILFHFSPHLSCSMASTSGFNSGPEEKRASINTEESTRLTSEIGSDSSQNEQKTLEMVRSAYGPNEGRRILKNLVGISIPFVLIFSSFQALSSIQSSLNSKDGLGPYSLATIHISGCISSLFFLSFILSKIPCKLAMVTCVALYSFYVLAQFRPMFATLLPTGVIMGIGGCVLWTGMSNYVSRISQEYGYITGEDVAEVLAKFFGIFFLFYQTAGIWGNIILTTIFSTSGKFKDDVGNYTEITASCGASFCPGAISSNSTDNGRDLPPQFTLNLIFGAYLICAVIAALIMNFCVDSLSRYGEGCKETQKHRSGAQLFLATLNQMTDPNQFLLIPLIFFSTFQAGFFAIDFTAGYITCAWGLEHIGKIMISFSLTAALSSFIFSRLIKYIGRLGVFSIIIAAHLSADVLMLYWIPSASQPNGFFIIAIIAGSVEGVCSAQITAFSAIVFEDNKEVAFNNMRIWQSIGFITACINATLFCIEPKLYLAMGVAIVGFIGYVIVEIRYRNRTKMQRISTVC